jgi:hypothetical protein
MADRRTAGGEAAHGGGRRESRRRWRRTVALPLPLALLLLATATATVTARPARERSPEQIAALHERRAGTQEQRAAARRQRQEEARRAREERGAHNRAGRRGHPPARTREGHRRPGRHGHGNERENAVVTSTCTVVNWTFRKFPNLPNNSIIERIDVGHFAPIFETVHFDGEGAATLSLVNPPPGKSRLDTGAKWKGNGAQGGFDIHSRKKCPPLPALTIEKLQRTSGSFTKLPLSGPIGQVVEYEIIVRNTGNVPLTLSNFTDERCDKGTIKGGPGSNPLQPGPTPALGESTTYTCSHTLTNTELYENAATVTGTPTEGSTVTHTSNTVVVNGPVTPEPALTIEKLQRIEGAGEYTTSALSGKAGQTVDYKMVVKNTGNTSLTLSNFTDEHCDAGTISAGLSKPLAPNESFEYTCHHLLTSADQTAGSYANAATVTGTPPEGSAITHTSNTVVVTLTAVSEPAFAIEKRQQMEGTGEYTTSPLSGKAGQTVEYQIIVTNTGNVPLTLSNFSDGHCDAGTITNGPTKELAPQEAFSYLCRHVLTSADQTAGSYSNEATVTGTPPEGSAITHTSNKVVVTLPTAGPPNIYLAYADNLESNRGGPSGIPSPWMGSPGVTFVGCGFGGTDRCPTSNGADVYDAGAIMIEATKSSGALTLSGASVTIGPCKYEPWPGLNATIQPGHSLILTETGKHRCSTSSTAEQDNFDTSESFLLSPQYQQFLKTGSCSNDGYIPAISLTINGKTATVNDGGQVLNGGGIDLDICRKATEAVNWVKLPSTAASRFSHALTCPVRMRHRRAGGHPSTVRALCPRTLRTT